jgi:hypothetical protein
MIDALYTIRYKANVRDNYNYPVTSYIRLACQCVSHVLEISVFGPSSWTCCRHGRLPRPQLPRPWYRCFVFRLPNCHAADLGPFLLSITIQLSLPQQSRTLPHSLTGLQQATTLMQRVLESGQCGKALPRTEMVRTRCWIWTWLEEAPQRFCGRTLKIAFMLRTTLGQDWRRSLISLMLGAGKVIRAEGVTSRLG